ncbi:YopX protein [compost metagenome]
MHKDLKSTGNKAGHYISNSAGAPFAYAIRPETVGQYTGLKDKNAREIYEGDVTKDEFDRVAVISWKENEARFAMQYVGQKTEYRMFISHLKMEVIGNIYENPELLP